MERKCSTKDPINEEDPYLRNMSWYLFSCLSSLSVDNIIWIKCVYYQCLLTLIKYVGSFIHKYFEIVIQKRLHDNLKCHASFKSWHFLELGLQLEITYSLRSEEIPYLETKESKFSFILIFLLFKLFLLNHNVPYIFCLSHRFFKRQGFVEIHVFRT